MNRTSRHFLIALALLFLPIIVLTHSYGPQGNYTNDAGNNNCTACHNSYTLNSGSGNLVLSGLPSQFVGGQTYNLTVQLNQSGQSRWGFQIKASGGTLSVVSSSLTQLYLGTIVMHTTAGTFAGQANSAQWPVRWTAPTTSSPVTFYFAGNAANNNGLATGDYIYTRSTTISKASLADNVSNFKAENRGSGQVKLSWTNPASNFKAVLIRRKTAGFPANTADGSQVYWYNGTTVTDTGLSSDSLYFYTAFSQDSSDIYSSGAKTSIVAAYPIPDYEDGLPGLKLYLGTEFPNAFDLEDFNSGGEGSSHSLVQNFQGLATLSGSTLSQGAYSLATAGVNMFQIANSYGTVTASGVVKYSTYKIMKLPKIGMNIGTSVDIPVGLYCRNSAGQALPPSFGVATAVWMDDANTLSASWMDNTVLRITALSGFTARNNVYVIATDAAGSSDFDIENIEVNPNLLKGSTFTAATDTVNFAYQLPDDKQILPAISWVSTLTDSAGTTAQGVAVFTLSNVSSGVKATNVFGNMIQMKKDEAYIGRMRICSPNAGNNVQSHLFMYNGIIPQDSRIDVAANILFGTPTVWTWVETPMLSHGVGTGYAQFFFKAGSGSAVVYLDEVQIINAIPTLGDIGRGNKLLHYPYSYFNSLSALAMGWATTESYASEYPQKAAFGVSSSGQMLLDFSGAGTGTQQKGAKLTARNNTSGVYTPASTPGREVGMMMKVRPLSGSFNSYEAVVLLACYGVATNGMYEFYLPPGQLMASAEFGKISGGQYYTVGAGRNGYHQFQFSAKNSQAGVLAFDQVDFLRDNDDPWYADPLLIVQ